MLNGSSIKSDLDSIIELNTKLVNIYNQMKYTLNELHEKTKKFVNQPYNNCDIAKKLYKNIQTLNDNFANVCENQCTQVSQIVEELNKNLVNLAKLDQPIENKKPKHEPINFRLSKNTQQVNTNLSDSGILSTSECNSPSIASTCFTRKRGTYHVASSAERMHALKLANAIGVLEAAKKLNIPAKNIKRWLSTGPNRKKGGGRKMLDPIMESQLSAWIREQENVLGHYLTRSQIKRKARELSKIPGFKASKGWLDKFKKRAKVNFLPMFAENFTIKYETKLEKDSHSKNAIPIDLTKITTFHSQNFGPLAESVLEQNHTIYFDKEIFDSSCLKSNFIWSNPKFENILEDPESELKIEEYSVFDSSNGINHDSDKANYIHLNIDIAGSVSKKIVNRLEVDINRPFSRFIIGNKIDHIYDEIDNNWNTITNSHNNQKIKYNEPTILESSMPLYTRSIEHYSIDQFIDYNKGI